MYIRGRGEKKRDEKAVKERVAGYNTDRNTRDWDDAEKVKKGRCRDPRGI
jgi:hypothetical protein